MTDFLPNDYKIPQSPSGYMRFQPGLNSIRILSSAIVGYEYFTNENKPVRQKEAFDEMPTDIKQGGKIKPFWAFVVYNYQLKMIQILELTQKSIMTSVKALVDNPKWGAPQNYDIAITKIGEGMDTEYTVQGEPPIAAPSEEVMTNYLAKYINLNALFEGKDPFQK
jgi:hypothetical protein